MVLHRPVESTRITGHVRSADELLIRLEGPLKSRFVFIFIAPNTSRLSVYALGMRPRRRICLHAMVV
jgi:hypothetical protein